MKECTRCGQPAQRLYHFELKDDDEQLIKHELCWDCDHDITNGGDIFEDPGDIIMDRWENEYAYDPINTPKPSWLP